MLFHSHKGADCRHGERDRSTRISATGNTAASTLPYHHDGKHHHPAHPDGIPQPITLHVTINVMEAVNFIAETSCKDHSIDHLYNVHVFPKLLDYEVMVTGRNCINLICRTSACVQGVDKPGFSIPD